MTDGTGGPPGNFSQILGDFSAQADAMVTAAKEGRFAVSEEMGNAYKAALQEYADNWGKNNNMFIQLAQAPELGTSPYALDVGKHAALVAEGDEQSALTQLDALREVVTRALDAINTAMTNYKNSDDQNKETLLKIHHD
ncbi:hypothetical protein BS329_27810 [Amycolatopsis coloradensis]|uniref:PE domain-containing protein n=1 Tax=Amycolatopsis coloradensis TaxID=76021 RepID=A0A1R0KM26_9PSEU|nr:hypothetical protein [Amycolatopsis coloradensis]OLZ47682.1 hypothetical protein BS329_27810 [Amycolatopsis coloradensis]